MNQAHILIVEDDAGLLEGIRTILELDGYTVLSAENGEQALDLLARLASPPDLIVSDIMMPRMDGIQLLKEVRRNVRFVSVPFIFLTAKSDKSDVQRGKKLGVDDYLVKPFDAEDLLIAVEARINRQRALDAVHENSIVALKKNILTILNHEFRTPLTFVVAYADLLNNQDLTAMNDTEVVSFLRGVGTGASRLRRLVENFILLVELETGDAYRTYEWRKSVIDDLPKVLHEAVERAQQLENITHPFQIVCERPLPSITADREYLSIAIGQLVSNAMKFSERTQPFEVGAQPETDGVRIWVKDSGRGIAEHELAHIWETFYQINRQQHEDQGAGSGLPIVQGIIHMHGGTVEVASQPEQGSTFSILLPL